jgi:4-hydroxy-tetrahydrodipicolinate reductase
MIRVVVTGVSGRMGSTICRGIFSEKDIKLVAGVSNSKAGRDIGQIIGVSDIGIKAVKTIEEAFDSKPEVLIDFTHASVAPNNIIFALENKIHAVVGTTGIDEQEIQKIKENSEEGKANVIIAPNFAVGAVLMMNFVKKAAPNFKDCEIIELHHDKKADAPSGTALATAELIKSVYESRKRLKEGEREKVKGARGCLTSNIHIHSVRLPGLMAHQEVIFGTTGQTLTIRHDSISRDSFLPGIFLAVRNIAKMPGFNFGIDKLLGF